jgi:spore maturation protein A
MMNIIWSIIMILSIGVALITGKTEIMTAAIMDGAKEAVNLCIIMAAVVGLWSGITEIGAKSGLMDDISIGMSPFLKWMFPEITSKEGEMKFIATNFAANILGLGWAATPAGLQAMEMLKKRSNKDEATDEMCTFVLLNISSLQLIPLTIVMYRSQYGSRNPAAIVFPGLIATTISTISAILFSKWMCAKSGKKKGCKK